MLGTKTLHFSRPKDRTLESYKEWIKGISKSLNIPKDDSTPEEIEADWKEFWAKVDASKSRVS